MVMRVETPAPVLLDRAETLPQIFDVVKTVVRRHLKTERTGLMLGLANLGGGQSGLVGGFFQVAGNMIVMNTLPFKRMEATRPDLRTPFAFHILLHEYIHSIGYLTEQETRPLVLEISRAEFGEEHPVTKLAEDWRPFWGDLVYPVYGWQPPGGFELEVVRGFDADASPYIQ